jgi:hypothetical protein
MKKNTALKAVPRKGQTATDLSPTLVIDPVIARTVENDRAEIEKMNKQLNELVTTAKQVEATIQQKQSIMIGMLQSQLIQQGLNNFTDYEYSFEEKGFKKIK